MQNTQAFAENNAEKPGEKLPFSLQEGSRGRGKCWLEARSSPAGIGSYLAGRWSPLLHHLALPFPHKLAGNKTSEQGKEGNDVEMELLSAGKAKVLPVRVQALAEQKRLRYLYEEEGGMYGIYHGPQQNQDAMKMNCSCQQGDFCHCYRCALAGPLGTAPATPTAALCMEDGLAGGTGRTRSRGPWESRDGMGRAARGLRHRQRLISNGGGEKAPEK